MNYDQVLDRLEVRNIVNALRTHVIIPLCIKHNLIYLNGGRRDFFYTNELNPVNEEEYPDLEPILEIIYSTIYTFCLGNLIPDVTTNDLKDIYNAK